MFSTISGGRGGSHSGPNVVRVTGRHPQRAKLEHPEGAEGMNECTGALCSARMGPESVGNPPVQTMQHCSLSPRSSGVRDEFAAASNRIRTTAVAGSAPAAVGAEHAAGRSASGLRIGSGTVRLSSGALWFGSRAERPGPRTLWIGPCSIRIGPRTLWFRSCSARFGARPLWFGTGSLRLSAGPVRRGTCAEAAVGPGAHRPIDPA